MECKLALRNERDLECRESILVGACNPSEGLEIGTQEKQQMNSLAREDLDLYIDMTAISTGPTKYTLGMESSFKTNSWKN